MSWNKLLFIKQEFQEAWKSLKQAFLFSMLNRALHSCPKKLVSTAEKKCFIERHKPSTLKMGSALSIWNWIKKKKLPKIFAGDTDFLFLLFFKGLSWMFSFLFVCLSFSNYLFPSLNRLLSSRSFDIFSPCYSSSFSSFVFTLSLHF